MKNIIVILFLMIYIQVSFAEGLYIDTWCSPLQAEKSAMTPLSDVNCDGLLLIDLPLKEANKIPSNADNVQLPTILGIGKGSDQYFSGRKRCAAQIETVSEENFVGIKIIKWIGCGKEEIK